MPRSIQIRNVPESVHRILCLRAAAAGLSLSDYLLAELIQVAERPAVGDVLARAAATPGKVDLKTIVESVRAGRDEV